MAVFWVFGAFGALICTLLAYIGLRDRRRLSSDHDTAAGLTAAAEAQRHATDAQAWQSMQVIRDQIEGHP